MRLREAIERWETDGLHREKKLRGGGRCQPISDWSIIGETRTGKLSCKVGRAARQLVEVHGGRILSTYWTEGDSQMIIAFEGRDEEQAMKVYDDLASQQDVDIRMVCALTEGEKERFSSP